MKMQTLECPKCKSTCSYAEGDEDTQRRAFHWQDFHAVNCGRIPVLVTLAPQEPLKASS
jgi:hypothetical protein